MLVTDLAYRDMEARADGLAARIGRLFARALRRKSRDGVQEQPYVVAPEHRAHLRLVGVKREPSATSVPVDHSRSGDFRWRRHPQLLRQAHDAIEPDPEDLERSARSASVRGLFLARSGRIDDARDAFATAARDASIDLTAIPGFWDLSRGGMVAAVRAYEDVERFRDASALEARIRLKYRPRSVGRGPQPSGSRTSASGT
jgi:hypothetical protein